MFGGGQSRDWTTCHTPRTPVTSSNLVYNTVICDLCRQITKTFSVLGEGSGDRRPGLRQKEGDGERNEQNSDVLLYSVNQNSGFSMGVGGGVGGGGGRYTVA